MDSENSQTTTQSAKSIFSSTRTHKKKLVFFVVLGVIVAGVVVALLTGFLAITFKTPGQKVVLSSQLCSGDTVTKYNNAMKAYYGDTPSEAVGVLESLAQDIAKRSGHLNDSSCVFIRYKVAMIKTDYATAKAMLERFRQLAEEGQSADGRLDGLLSIKQMENSLILISPVSESGFDD